MMASQYFFAVISESVLQSYEEKLNYLQKTSFF